MNAFLGGRVCSIADLLQEHIKALNLKWAGLLSVVFHAWPPCKGKLCFVSLLLCRLQSLVWSSSFHGVCHYVCSQCWSGQARMPQSGPLIQEGFPRGCLWTWVFLLKGLDGCLNSACLVGKKITLAVGSTPMAPSICLLFSRLAWLASQYFFHLLRNRLTRMLLLLLAGMLCEYVEVFMKYMNYQTRCLNIKVEYLKTNHTLR